MKAICGEKLTEKKKLDEIFNLLSLNSDNSLNKTPTLSPIMTQTRHKLPCLQVARPLRHLSLLSNQTYSGQVSPLQAKTKTPCKY